MHVGHVQGGTHAGWRKVREPKMWKHFCRKPKGLVETTLYSCPYGCGARRPKENPSLPADYEETIAAVRR